MRQRLLQMNVYMAWGEALHRYLILVLQCYCFCYFVSWYSNLIIMFLHVPREGFEPSSPGPNPVALTDVSYLGIGLGPGGPVSCW